MMTFVFRIPPRTRRPKKSQSTPPSHIHTSLPIFPSTGGPHLPFWIKRRRLPMLTSGLVPKHSQSLSPSMQRTTATVIQRLSIHLPAFQSSTKLLPIQRRTMSEIKKVFTANACPREYCVVRAEMDSANHHVCSCRTLCMCLPSPCLLQVWYFDCFFSYFLRIYGFIKPYSIFTPHYSYHVSRWFSSLCDVILRI